MGSFNSQKSGGSGVNASTQQSSATGQSSSFGYGTSGSTQAQNVWGAQAPALQALYGQAGQALSGPVGGGVAAPARASWLDALAPGFSPQFQQSMDATLGAIGRNFSQSVLPSLRSDAVGVGAFGTPRAQFAEAEAAGLAAQEMSTAARQLAGQQYATDQAGRLQALQLAPTMAGLEFAPLAAARDAIGAPTVLGSGGSFSNQVSGSQATNSAQSTGSSFGNTQNRAQGFGMGIGEK